MEFLGICKIHGYALEKIMEGATHMNFRITQTKTKTMVCDTPFQCPYLIDIWYTAIT